MFILCMFVLHLVFTCNGDAEFLCSTEFCAEQREDGECEDIPCNGKSGKMLSSPTPCNCCEHCFTYLEENDPCSEGLPGSATVHSICGPGLTCLEDKCQSMSLWPKHSKCVEAQVKFDSEASYAEISWRPVCDNEGNFGPVHCIPNSICYCIEPESGTRIFGEEIYSSEVAERMTCSCSLAAWKAAELGEKTEFFRCLANGEYDELQCVDGECMCVDKNGTPIDSYRVHVNNLEEGALSCFDETIHPEGRFEKSCELEYKTKIDEVREWEIEGFDVLNVDLPKCTPDGYYHRVHTRRNSNGFKCVDPAGNLISSYDSDEGDSDCNCAYTSWLMKEAGLQELPTCNPDGTFQSWQCSRDKCYCVNKYGDQNYPHESFSNIKELPCYNE